MSRIEQLEKQIAGLSPEEFRELRAWFQHFDDELWDRQIESDSKSGKLRQFAEDAIRDHNAGRSTEL